MAFGFLKKIFGGSKKPDLPPALNAAMAKIQAEVFPDGDAQIDKELKECANILGVSPNKIRGTFNYACVRAFLGNCDKNTLITGIARHDDGLSEDQIELFAKFVFAKMIKQRLGLTDDFFINESLKAAGFNGVKGNYDEIPGGYGEFGLTVTNPVPVNGVPSNEVYLSRLVTSDGRKIKWDRLGSTGAENIDMPVDIYNITDENGEELPTIYISSYHPKMSNHAPRGYRFK